MGSELVTIKIGRPAAWTCMKASLVTHELLSALADDRLGPQACSSLLEACKSDDSAVDCWRIYQLIGEQLRTPASTHMLVRMDDELAFARRLNKRLAGETFTAPLHVLLGTAPVIPVADQRRPAEPAANDSSFRWKLVAGVASLAAVATIAWNASGLQVPSSMPQLASVLAPQIVVTSTQGPVVRDLKLEEMLAAHRQLGTSTALQESSGFLRNAMFEMPRELPQDTAPGSGR